jgi:aerobic-type carbon monoxide dehydrogenase small subunit (CoxS/CutS family)
VYNCGEITEKEVNSMLGTQLVTNSKLVETIEMVEQLKKLSPLEQSFIKGYIQGILDSQPEPDQKQPA